VLCKESFLPQPMAVSTCRRTRPSGAEAGQPRAKNSPI
ncbi:hypothetical protein AVDCRST_MAG84-2499, partial [uncultured Microcoleus sp.]